MNVNKKLISNKLSDDINISKQVAVKFVNHFIFLIKDNAQDKTIKIAGFGTFLMNKTLGRVGRNPKTKESYIITPRIKLNFRASNILKNFLNP